jgi:hypothetical protein
MHAVATGPDAVPEWTFAPSWSNPRVRRYTLAVMVRYLVVSPLLFLFYRTLLGWTSRMLLFVMLPIWVVTFAVFFARSSPPKRRLLINPFGLAYRSYGSATVRAIWADIESVGRYRWLWFPAEEGVFLSKGAWMSNPLMGLYGRWYRFVPLTLFDPDWRTGEIGGLIRRYAPQLFES